MSIDYKKCQFYQHVYMIQQINHTQERYHTLGELLSILSPKNRAKAIKILSSIT